MGSAEQTHQADPEPSHSGASGEAPRYQMRRPRRGPSREELHADIYMLRTQRRRLAISTSVLAVGCVGLSIGMFRAQTLLTDAHIVSQSQRTRLELGIRESESKFASAQRELEQSRKQIKDLVNQRIPGLKAIELSRPIRVQQDYVRDITFENPGGQLEYKVVIENTSGSLIEPSLVLRVFDEVGMQLGDSEPIAKQGAEAEMLRAGEIRSFFATLDSDLPGTPAYFRIAAND